MTTATMETTFANHVDTLRQMAVTLRDVVAAEPGIEIAELLEKASKSYGTTPSQMKYALSFAGVKKLVSIDYDSATVSAV